METKIISRPWKKQDLLDDLQMYIDEENDNYLNGRRAAMCMARDYLSHYFKAEEEGRLIILPCKRGDTIYVIDWYLDCDINGFDVCDDYRKNDEIACGYCRHNVIKRFVSERKFENQKIEDFGKTVFLSREDAEAALRGD